MALTPEDILPRALVMNMLSPYHINIIEVSYV